jgi:hypothetical protein
MPLWVEFRTTILARDSASMLVKGLEKLLGDFRNTGGHSLFEPMVEESGQDVQLHVGVVDGGL